MFRELRALAKAFPDDGAVRHSLAMGLCDMCNDAQAEGERERRDALLDELRALAKALPDAGVSLLPNCVS